MTEREHCASVAREIRAKIETRPGDASYRLADRIQRERADAFDKGIELAIRAIRENGARAFLPDTAETLIREAAAQRRRLQELIP